MTKMLAGFAVAVMAAFMSFGFMTSAHADYGDNGTPPTSETPPAVESVSPPTSSTNAAAASSPSSASSGLPNTGGPNEYALVGAVALIAAGGASIAVSRRRRTI